ncbi:MAG TPA: hypothetical protein PKA07_02860 [Micropruina sp.]|nr:hypothetical protein [Micropruina sp.]
MAGQTLRRKAAAPAPEAPDASEVAAVEVVEPVRAEDVALAVGEPLVTRMADPDGTVHEIVPAGVEALLVLGWTKA